MVFSGEEGIHWYFFVFFDQMCTTLLLCISNHAFLVCLKQKCHIINFLLTSLARYVQRNIGPRSFCNKPRPTYSIGTKKTSFPYFSVRLYREITDRGLVLRSVIYRCIHTNKDQTFSCRIVPLFCSIYQNKILHQ